MEEMRLSENCGENIWIDRSAILTSFVPPLHGDTTALIGQTVLSTRRNRTCSIPASCNISVCNYTCMPHSANFIAWQNCRFLCGCNASWGSSFTHTHTSMHATCIHWYDSDTVYTQSSQAIETGIWSTWKPGLPEHWWGYLILPCHWPDGLVLVVVL